MKYPPLYRVVKLWELVNQDPDCLACQKELREAKKRLEERTDGMTKEESLAYWELPTCIHAFFGRVLELAAEQMQFPEESDE